MRWFKIAKVAKVGKDFKLLDESQVLLKVPRQNNMYKFDLKNVVSSGDLSCLFAKATIDESNLWNKARLVAQGHTQEEGIDYDEVFAQVARIEAIRLFLAHASFKDFIVYQMNVKSAFLYGTIEEEVYVCQPSRFVDPDFPDKMSSMGELTFFLGLQVKQKQDGIFISQHKYVAEILKKFVFTKVKTASTPLETSKPLLKDEDGQE
nr:copia protein [Tanacetum cinerariifolium]